MNPCDSVQPELKAYLDGQLPYMLRQRVRRHLSACAACREELSAMEQITNQLHTDTPKPLESSLRARILNAVTQSSDPHPAPTPAKPFWRQRKPLLIWGGVATAVVAWFTLYPLLHGDLLRDVTSRSPSAGSTEEASKSVSAAPAAPAASAPMARTSRGIAGEADLAGAPADQGRPAAGKHGNSATNLYSLTSGARHVPAHEPATKMAMGATAALQSSQVYNGPVASAKAPQSQMPVNYFELEEAKKKGVVSAFGGGRTHATLQGMVHQEDVERQVHREATLSVQVDNVEAKSETATEEVQLVGGFVASNELNTGEDNLKTASLSLKVPVAQFERVLNQVTKLGEVKAKNITGEDLTEQISDQQQSEHVLRQDIDTTQEELTHRLNKTGRQERMDTMRELRTRIAQTQARLKLLRKLGALSTITLELTEKPRLVPPAAPKTGGFVGDLNDTLHAAVQSMFQAARLPILTFIWILAYSPLWILLILGYRYAVRR